MPRLLDYALPSRHVAPVLRSGLEDGVDWVLGVEFECDLLVVAVGDVARYVNGLFDSIPRRVEHWNLPTETGKRAGQILAGQLAGRDADALAATPFAPLPSFWSDQYDANLLAFGMTYLADRSELVAGTPDTECVVEYFLGDDFVGVCGIGMRSAVQSYRSRFVASVAWRARKRETVSRTAA